jgi:uncharacterized protein (TIGR02246 family)
MTFDGSSEDRLAIRELYGAYSDATMRQDRSLYLSLWCEDGVRISADEELRGKPSIARHWDGVWSMVRQMGFFTEIGTISVTGETASARVFCREVILLASGRVWKVIGRYDDLLEKAEGRWRLKRREYRIILDEGRPEAPTV